MIQRILREASYSNTVPAATLASALGTGFADIIGETSSTLTTIFSDAFTVYGAYGGSQTDRPRAFLNYILFDKDHNFIDMGAERIGTGGMFTIGNPSLGVHEQLSFSQAITVDKAGYLYIYVSNETELSEVYFDDIKITHVKSPIVQKDDYYPFGLTFGGYQRQGETENKLNTFQDQELIDDLDLNWVQFKWRNHDPAIGRFFNVDPLAEKYVYNSPYAFSENHVTSHVELEGLEKMKFMAAMFDGNNQAYWFGEGRVPPKVNSRFTDDISPSTKLEFTVDISTGEFTNTSSSDDKNVFEFIGDGLSSEADFSLTSELTDNGLKIDGNLEGMGFKINIGMDGDELNISSIMTDVPNDDASVLKAGSGNSVIQNLVVGSNKEKNCFICFGKKNDSKNTNTSVGFSVTEDNNIKLNSTDVDSNNQRYKDENTEEE